MGAIRDDPRFKTFFQNMDHADIKSITADVSLREFIAGMLSYHPWWLAMLYKLREILVKLLGLSRHDEPEWLAALHADAISFVPGDQALFFIVRKAEENSFWIAESPADNHLAAYIGVVAHKLNTGMTRFSVFSTVRYLHWTGPVYFNLIRPFHHLVVLKMMQAGTAYQNPIKATEGNAWGEDVPSENETEPKLIDRFSIGERLLFRVGWYGFMIVGTWGIFMQAPLWAMIYLGSSLLAFAVVILPGLCAHCPYPSRYTTCLFLPPAFLNRFYPYKGPQMRPVDKILVSAAMAGIVIMPQFWLITDLPLLALFWLLALPVLAAFPMHYCMRCRHFNCPMNKAGQPTHKWCR